MMERFTLGTRGSALALAQAELTRHALAAVWSELTVAQQVFVTRGDVKLDLSLIRAAEAGGKGLFTKELEDALLGGTIDVAVHSLKDLPGHNPPGLAVTAVLERAATADVLIARDARAFDELPPGAVLGTSSVRRARQLRWLRPDLVIEEWRGNVQTRLRKLGESDRVAGIILAQAGLERLGYDLAAGTIEFAPWSFRAVSLADHLLPAIGQGAIALQSRADRAEVTTILQKLDHPATHTAIRAERELQRLLAGDCGMPVGVRTTLRGDHLHLRAILFGPEAEPPKTAEAEGPAATPEAVAAELFAQLAPAS
ncbi:MAG: hydroxymethylbilane synthase [Chthoniobacter sp.]|nr:hydroxymethylbilane synthase [Chthoniobacter sp.]